MAKPKVETLVGEILIAISNEVRVGVRTHAIAILAALIEGRLLAGMEPVNTHKLPSRPAQRIINQCIHQAEAWERGERGAEIPDWVYHAATHCRSVRPCFPKGGE